MTLPDTHVEDPRMQRNVDHINAFGVPVKVLDHAPTDADFNLPSDGYLAIDLTGPTLYMRAAGAWSAV